MPTEKVLIDLWLLHTCVLEIAYFFYKNVILYLYLLRRPLSLINILYHMIPYSCVPTPLISDDMTWSFTFNMYAFFIEMLFTRGY